MNGIVQCSNCHQPFPDEGLPYRCTHCGGIFDFVEFPPFQGEQKPDLPGIWKYGESLGLGGDPAIVTLGEGHTPLVFMEAFGKNIAFKCEYQNPTGSYKDRGASTLASVLVSRGIEEAVEDSSGNAGAAFAAYAARAGIHAQVFIPDATAGPKRRQIEKYGAEIVRILGSRSDVAEKTRAVAAAGKVYASHAYLPFVLGGYATMAYEIYTQLGQLPGSVIVPVGQGNLLVSLARGFKAVAEQVGVPASPMMVGVQAQVCAPLWALYSFGPAGLGWVSEAQTAAEGVRVRHPIRGDTALRAVESSGGLFIAVDEDKILTGRDELARRGFYVEPTSALVWDAMAQTAGSLPEPIVVVLTGSGLKSLE